MARSNTPEPKSFLAGAGFSVGVCMSSKENSLTNRSEMVVHVPLVQAHVSHSTIPFRSRS